MNTQDTRQRITAYLAKFFPAHTLADDDDLFRLGFVNSMFAIQLVNFVEHEFGIEIENDDMDPGNFRTIRALVQFVQRKASPAVVG